MKNGKKAKSLLNVGRIHQAQRRFVKERDWEKFHTPKNLTMALTGEAAELMEHFQWLTDETVKTAVLDRKKKQAVSEEIADVFFYLMRLADVLQIDVEKAFWNKMKKNRLKYPASLCKGSVKKYDELQPKKFALEI